MHPGSSIGPSSSWEICLRHALAHQRGFFLRPLWSQLVLGWPLQLQGPIPVFFLILPMVSLEVAQLITGEAPPGLHLLGSHSMGHLHLEDRIIGYGLLQITGDEQPFIIFLRKLIAIGICPFLGRRLNPQPQGWWQQMPWSYEIMACNQRYGQRPLVDWWMNWHLCL